MTTNLEQAFPLNANWPAATVRSKLAEAMIAVFDTADLAGEDFSIQPYPAIAVYGADGDLTLYAYDATDTTTADDGGISCIVVSGRRYKRAGEMAVRDAAISATTDTQPVSPSLGDTYIVPAAPSGDDWASKAKTVAQYTARGWQFRQPFVGMTVYVEDEDAIYHYDSGGDWVKGLPIGAIQDGSIPPKKLAHPFALLKVEDQRNDPPGTAPTIGTMYQVGTSPTGDFSAHANEVARWNEGAAWEFIAPEEGDTIYRKDLGVLYSYRSGVWEPTIPATVLVQSYFVDYVTSSTAAKPLTNRLSSPTITAAPGQKIRIALSINSYVSAAPSGGAATNSLGIRIDTEGSMTKTLWSQNSSSAVAPTREFYFAEIDATDTLPHVYHIATLMAGGTGGSIGPTTMAATFEVIQPSS